MRITTGAMLVGLMALSQAAPGSAQDCGWQWVNPAPPRVDILRLKYESHAFVGVGLRGTVIRSTDGYSWRLVDPGVRDDLLGIDWGAGAWVAVGRGVILNSVNGFNWSVVFTDPSVTFLDVEFSASRYVAVGDGLDGQIVTSQMGQDWQSVPVPWVGSADSITGTPDGFFVAVGPEVWFSPDGFDWQYRSAVPASPIERCPSRSIQEARLGSVRARPGRSGLGRRPVAVGRRQRALVRRRRRQVAARLPPGRVRRVRGLARGDRGAGLGDGERHIRVSVALSRSHGDTDLQQ